MALRVQVMEVMDWLPAAVNRQNGATKEILLCGTS
jgi:hypothetical protein